MGWQFFKESYSGRIREITLGDGPKAVTVGGESCYPFYQFEGKMPHPPRVAMEVWDMEPEDWPEAALAPLRDVLSDPAAWARKCVEEYGAELIALQLKSIDPNGRNAPAEEAVATVRKVRAAVEVPLIVWGCANVEKDEAVLKKIAEACQGMNLILGPVEDKNHKAIGAAAMGFGHFVIASSPIDVNLAKQINILLENLGVPPQRMLIDPTTGGLGYGLEYTYSVMERIRMAALAQGDDKLQLPIVNNIGNEVWKSKEAKLGAADAPTLGDPERRAVLMETTAAVAYLMAGSDILILRHPESVRLVKSYIGLILNGGDARRIAPIAKRLPAVPVDLAALAPAPDLTIPEEKEKKPAAAEAKAAPPPPKPAAAPAAEAKPAPAPAAQPAAAPEAPKPAAAPAEDEAARRAREEAEARAKAEAEAKARAEAEAKAKAEAEAKAKAEAEAKAKAEAEAKAKAEAEAKAKLEGELDRIRQQRAKEREARAAQAAAAQPSGPKEKPRPETPARGPKAPAVEPQTVVERLIENLSWIHRRNR
ncbi:MAG: acetyl-CoA decarbonylase/synthase complex subunit delta [Desulfobacterales bacterium]